MTGFHLFERITTVPGTVVGSVTVNLRPSDRIGIIRMLGRELSPLFLRGCHVLTLHPKSLLCQTPLATPSHPESRKWREATSRKLDAMSRTERLAYLKSRGELSRAELRVRHPAVSAS